jgi:signal peptidase I
MLQKRASKMSSEAGTSNSTGKSPASRAVSSSLEAILFLLATVVVAAAIGPVAGWWHYEVIESGSMTPALRVGGVAVLWPEAVSSVRAGQVIAFHPPGQGNYVRIHRVISVTDHDGQVWVRTKGDANNAADPGPVLLDGKTAYAEHYFVPYLGYLGVWLYKQSTRVALEVVLFVLMVAGGLSLIWGKKDREEEVDNTVEKELVIPARWPRQNQQAALTAQPVVENRAVENLVVEHLVAEHRTAEHRTSGQRLAEQRAAKKASAALAASAASTASTSSLLALSHIYTARPEGGEVAPAAEEPVAKQQAIIGG